MIPCVVFEDEHLLVANKPAGLNTHAPAPFAGEGLYDWLRHREPRWARLSIIHRLDKETSGLLVFGKSTLANRSLTAQFAERAVHKKYVLLTDRSLKQRELTVKSRITRAGDRYVNSPHGQPAETRFHAANLQSQISNLKSIEAVPLTGRTHQIRVHAAASGFPILGDTLYGGSPFNRVCLHAAELIFRHPRDGKEIRFSAPAMFLADPAQSLRAALIDPRETNACRLIHGTADGWPGWYLDRFGDSLLSHSERPLSGPQRDYLERQLANSAPPSPPPPDSPPGAVPPRLRCAYHKILNRRVRGTPPAESSPQWVLGRPVNDPFRILENGVQFELSFNEGYSVGLFLDQRDNRRRLITGHVAAGFALPSSPDNERLETKMANGGSRSTWPGRLPAGNGGLELLNAFAYTCGFSICAAMAGAQTTSLDLSRKYLAWGKRNFALNKIDPTRHEFICGDVFEWLRRLNRKHRLFDIILLDPPTFSRSKQHGDFRAERDYPHLVRATLPLLRTAGILFASTNAADWPPAKFLAAVESAVRNTGRKILQRHYAPQPPDFPVSRAEPAYLKTLWMRIA